MKAAGSGLPRRRLTLSLPKVAKRAARRPSVTDEDLERAGAGADLIKAVLGEGGPELSASNLIEIPEEAFSAAHSILEHAEGNTGEEAALRAASEQIDPDAFTDLARHLLRLPAEPDAAIAREFI